MKKDIFISMDVSGKLNDSEKLCVMSGIVLTKKAMNALSTVII